MENPETTEKTEEDFNHWAEKLPKFRLIAGIEKFRVKALLEERRRALENIKYYSELVPALDEELKEVIESAWTKDEIAEAMAQFTEVKDAA